MNSKLNFILSITLCILTIVGCTSNTNESSGAAQTETKSQPTKPEINYVNCDQCNRSFDKQTGFQLTSHSEVFCSQNCASTWGFNNQIQVN